MRNARCCAACLPKVQGQDEAHEYRSQMDSCDFCGEAPESEVLYTLMSKGE